MSRKSNVDDTELRKVLAKNLWDLLEDCEITQQDLSDRTGVSKNTIQNILYERHTPTISVVAAIAMEMDVSIDSLCGLSECGIS